VGQGARLFVVMGQKVPIKRRAFDDGGPRSPVRQLRVIPSRRTADRNGVGELMLGSEHAEITASGARVQRGIRLEKSAVSEHFIEASRAKLKDLMERRLDKLRLCALLIDATPVEGQQMVVRRHRPGRAQTILGIPARATENATVVGELLGDLMNRGLDFTQPPPLRSGWRQGAARGGEEVCWRVGADPTLPGSQTAQCARSLDRRAEAGGGKELNAAYALEDYAAAKQALNGLHRELMDLNPSRPHLGKG